MAIMVTAGENKDYAPAPEGTHQAVCCDVIDLGEVLDTFNPGKKKRVISLVWQLGATITGRPERLTAGKRYRRSLNEKATLRHDLESWRGRPFTAAESLGFDLEKLIGANCLLNIVHKPSADGTKTYGNVVSVMPLMRGLPAMKVEDYVRRQDREAAAAAQAVPAAQVTTAAPSAPSAPPPLPPMNLSRDAAPPLTDDDIPF